MMKVFDLILLVFVSVLLAIKSIYLGSCTLVIGFLISFQIQRTLRLLGSDGKDPGVARKVKAAVLAAMIAACAIPLFMEPAEYNFAPVAFSNEVTLPIVIVLGLFSASVMAALAIEKRKR